MKKTRILSIFLSVCMILTCMVGMSVSASADDDTVTAGEFRQLYHAADELFEQMSAISTSTGYYDRFQTARRNLTQEGISLVSDNIGELSTNPDTPLSDGEKNLYARLKGYYDTAKTEYDAASNPTVITGSTDISALDEGNIIIKGAQITREDGSKTLRDGKDGAAEDFPFVAGHTYIVYKIDGDNYIFQRIEYTPANNGGDDPGNEEDPENGDEDDGEDDDDDINRRPWAEKPEYKPSGASGTAAPEEKPAEEPKEEDKQEEPKDNDKQEEPKDNDKQEEPKDNDKQEEPKDNDTTEIPEDKDTANDGTSTVVDGSKDTNENPHTGVALGGISVLVLAGAAMIVSKKRK